MAFKAGQSGNPNGRPFGAKTKFRLKTAMEIFEEYDFNPIEELLKIAKNAESIERKHRATSELAKYFAPQLKSTEMQVNVTAHESAIDELK